MNQALAALTEDEEILAELQEGVSIDRDLERNLYKNDFLAFVKAAWPIIEGKTEFVETWHIRVLCKLLHDIYWQKEKATRWVVNVPPGTMKSLLILVMWPAWIWTMKPTRRFLCGSYGQTLSLRDNLRMRDLVTSTWYQELWPMALVEDQNTKTRFNNEEGGWRIATSTGGPGVGEHPDYILIDDPISPRQAESSVEREAAQRWLDRTLSTRGLTRRVTMVLVMQRLHEEDPSGYLLKQGDCEGVCFPMEFDPKRADKRDQRTQADELLAPDLISRDKIERLKVILGPYGVAGQLQQTPAPEGGGLFQRNWFKLVSVLPTRMVFVRGWDTASTEGGGDWTVGVKLGEELELRPDKNGRTSWQRSGRIYVCDVVRVQLGPAEVDDLMAQTAQLDGRDCEQVEEQEGGSAGKSVIAARAKRMRGYVYSGAHLTGDKVTRAKPFRSQAQAGNVYVLEAGWTNVYLNELANFPTGKHDDQVDGSSASYNKLALEPPKRRVSASWAEMDI